MRSLDEPLLAFAGLWESWKDTDGTLLHTCTIITKAANEFMQPMHARMPVMLARDTYQDWLNQSTDRDVLTELIAQAGGPGLHADKVSPKVNSPVNNSSELIEPI